MNIEKFIGVVKFAEEHCHEWARAFDSFAFFSEDGERELVAVYYDSGDYKIYQPEKINDWDLKARVTIGGVAQDFCAQKTEDNMESMLNAIDEFLIAQPQIGVPGMGPWCTFTKSGGDLQASHVTTTGRTSFSVWGCGNVQIEINRPDVMDGHCVIKYKRDSSGKETLLALHPSEVEERHLEALEDAINCLVRI